MMATVTDNTTKINMDVVSTAFKKEPADALESSGNLQWGEIPQTGTVGGVKLQLNQLMWGIFISPSNDFFHDKRNEFKVLKYHSLEER